MRTGNKEAKETTRRLIKAGLAVGILGGGAATAQMDAFAMEKEVNPVKDYFDTERDVTEYEWPCDDHAAKNDENKDGENDALEEVAEIVGTTVEDITF